MESHGCLVIVLEANSHSVRNGLSSPSPPMPSFSTLCSPSDIYIDFYVEFEHFLCNEPSWPEGNSRVAQRFRYASRSSWPWSCLSSSSFRLIFVSYFALEVWDRVKGSLNFRLPSFPPSPHNGTHSASNYFFFFYLLIIIVSALADGFS